MDDITARYKMGYPETPVNLPDNQQQAEYGSDAIADLISSLGFEHVFLVPGSSFRGLHDSLVNHLRNRTPEMILCPTESIAVSMAHGYSKATGKPSLCIIHDLVGLMLGTMSVYNAACDRAPVVILGGSGPLNPDDRRYIDWAHTASSQCDLVKPMVKWTAEPPTLQSTLDQLAKAHKIAASAPTGPVYVSIDQGAQECAMPANLIIPDVDLPRYQPAPPTAANPDALAQAADMLLSAKMPLIIGGRFGRSSETTAPLVKLLELTGAAYVDDRSIV
jgi:acetolactate synthase-1/2/3 large subunit